MAAGAANNAERVARTILIVDDVSTNLELIASQLESRGYIVLVALGGQEGIERAAFANPDLILLDVIMPGMDGFETCRLLKQSEATRGIPVIFMTALNETADKMEAFRVGAVDYVTKPLNIEEVVARVEVHLALYTLRLQQAAQNRRLLDEIAASEQDLRFRKEEALEDERRRIARELHDELGQHLSAIRLELSFVRIRWGVDNPELHAKVQSLQASIDHVIEVVRDLVSGLRPAVLDMGIAAALEWLTCEFRATSRVRCDLQIDELMVLLNPWQTSMVFRLVQESLTNVARHARARSVVVSLQRMSDAYVLTIRDDGRGFDPAKAGKTSLGIQGMRERAQMLGGQLDLRSQPGDGTTIAVTFPADSAACPVAGQVPDSGGNLPQ